MKKILILQAVLTSQAMASSSHMLFQPEKAPCVKQLLQKFEPLAFHIKPQHINPLGNNLKKNQAILKPQVNLFQPKIIAPQGIAQPHRPLPQPKIIAPQGIAQPHRPLPQPKIIAPQGIAQPHRPLPQPKPVVAQGGVKAQVQLFQNKPVLPQGEVKPHVHVPQPKAVIAQDIAKPKPHRPLPQPKPVVAQGGVKAQIQLLQNKPVVPQDNGKPQVQMPQPKLGVGKLIQNIQAQKPQVIQPKLPIGKLAQDKLINIPIHAFGMGIPQNLLPKKSLMDFNNPDAYKIIHKINFTHITPNNTDIRQLLINAGLANNNILVDPATIITNIKGKGGSYTKFLYKVMLPAHVATDNQEKKLIIKGIYNHADPALEANNLIYLRKQQELLDLHQSNVPHVPKLGIDVLNYSYTANNGEQEYIAIMKKLSGKTLSTYLTQPEAIRHTMFKNVGRALGELHYRLADPAEKKALNQQKFDSFTTINHQDFHPGNILYNLKNQQVSFIDLERMADSHKNRNPFWNDTYQMYVSVQTDGEITQFLNGYVQAYPLAIQANLRNFFFNFYNL